jgi:hypothetical protein
MGGSDSPSGRPSTSGLRPIQPKPDGRGIHPSMLSTCYLVHSRYFVLTFHADRRGKSKKTRKYDKKPNRNAGYRCPWTFLISLSCHTLRRHLRTRSPLRSSPRFVVTLPLPLAFGRRSSRAQSYSPLAQSVTHPPRIVTRTCRLFRL